jgi:hypothetical protein
MKTTLFISALLLSLIASAQNPIQLLKQDSLKKAAQIFDRIYWMDTSSLIGTESLSHRTTIEQKIIERTKANFIGSWTWNWTGTGWGATDSPKMSGLKKRMELDCSTIKFYRNDSLIRETTYSLVQSFDWVYGYLGNLFQYQDTKEEWVFKLISIDNFTSNSLWIFKITKPWTSHPVGESYSLENGKQQLTSASMQ